MKLDLGLMQLMVPLTAKIHNQPWQWEIKRDKKRVLSSRDECIPVNNTTSGCTTIKKKHINGQLFGYRHLNWFKSKTKQSRAFTTFKLRKRLIFIPSNYEEPSNPWPDPSHRAEQKRTTEIKTHNHNPENCAQVMPRATILRWLHTSLRLKSLPSNHQTTKSHQQTQIDIPRSNETYEIEFNEREILYKMFEFWLAFNIIDRLLTTTS